jgi:hypothetical protein
VKLCLLLPDGVGVRNFIYSDFLTEAEGQGISSMIWAEPEILPLVKDSYELYSLPGSAEADTLTIIQRNAWRDGMIHQYAKDTQDDRYLLYLKKNKLKGISSRVKSLAETLLSIRFNNQSGLLRLKNLFLNRIRRSKYYRECKESLNKMQPDIILCAHQRPMKAIAPLLAASDLGIPTVTFIYSWDNLPKASLYVKSDHYLVWSEHMKNEILQYYPEVNESQVHVTGTPQFSNYFDKDLLVSREDFANEFKLPMDKKWLCFSGDDVTTSPFDHIYLEDLCTALQEWNENNEEQLHIIFRRCPVDMSGRYDYLKQIHSSILTFIDPDWINVSANNDWNKIVPGNNDSALLVNTVFHSAFVANVGSTMALDFSIFEKPGIFIDYIVREDSNWRSAKVYDYIHFRSMEGLDPVIWVKSKTEWNHAFQHALYEAKDVVADAKSWLEKLAKHPLQDFNQRAIKVLSDIHAYRLSDK